MGWAWQQNLILQGSTAGKGELAGALPLVTGTLTKKGTGTWTLDGANISSGATLVSGGVLGLHQPKRLSQI